MLREKSHCIYSTLKVSIFITQEPIPSIYPTVTPLQEDANNNPSPLPAPSLATAFMNLDKMRLDLDVALTLMTSLNDAEMRVRIEEAELEEARALLTDREERAERSRKKLEEIKNNPGFKTQVCL